MIFIDFETRSPRDNLKTAGAYIYAQSAEPLCLAYGVDDGPIRLWAPEYDPYPGRCPLEAELSLGHKLVAHNATFEYYVWNAIPGWPKVSPSDFIDTAAMAAACNLPRSLKGAAAALGLAAQKDTAGTRLIQKLCKPRKKPPLYNSNPTDLQALYDYCVQDVEVERQIYKALPALAPFEQYLWELTLLMNEFGLTIDVPNVRRAYEMFKWLNDQSDAAAKELTDGTVDSTRQVVEATKWICDQGVAIYDLRARTVKDTLERKDIPQKVRQFLLLRQEVGRSSISKYAAMLDRVSPDRRVRDNLMYHGAGPGRWTGTGIQIQNFPRGNLDGGQVDRVLEILGMGAELTDTAKLLRGEFKSVASPLSSSLRAMIVPQSDHYEFICSDFSAIEARGLSWLVGDEADLDNYRTGVNAYKALASKIYGVPADTIEKSSREYMLGKVAKLGLGYGMGAVKFRETCRLQFGLVIDEIMAQKTVDIYRQTCAKVPLFWREVESNVRAVSTSRLGTRVECGKYALQLTSIAGRQYLRLELPSGRPLYYCDPRLDSEGGLTFEGVESMSHQWKRMRTWGGVFTENIVQALSRDLLAEAVERVDKAGWRILTTVHDEILCEAPVAARRTVAELNALMCVAPSWAPDIPLEAEGWKGRRYKK